MKHQQAYKSVFTRCIRVLTENHKTLKPTARMVRAQAAPLILNSCEPCKPRCLYKAFLGARFGNSRLSKMHLIFSKAHLTISCHTDLPSTSQSILDVTAGNECALAKQQDNLAKPCTKVLYALFYHLWPHGNAHRLHWR